MKAVWCLIALSIALVHGKSVQNVAVIPQEYVSEILKASSDCALKYGMPADILQKVFAKQLDDSEKGKQYLHCLGSQSGYLNNSGYIEKKVLNIVGPFTSQASAAVDECNQAKYSNEYETAYNSVVCFYTKSGVEFRA